MEKGINKSKLRKCKYCGSDININPGLNNWKNLFRKPTFEDYITFFLIIIMIISSYSYKSDLKSIINYYENDSYCNTKNNNFQLLDITNPFLWNISNSSYPSNSIKEDG